MSLCSHPIFYPFPCSFTTRHWIWTSLGSSFRFLGQKVSLAKLITSWSFILEVEGLFRILRAYGTMGCCMYPVSCSKTDWERWSFGVLSQAGDTVGKSESQEPRVAGFLATVGANDIAIFAPGQTSPQSTVKADLEKSNPVSCQLNLLGCRCFVWLPIKLWFLLLVFLCFPNVLSKVKCLWKFQNSHFWQYI